MCLKYRIYPLSTCLNRGELLNLYNKLPDVWWVKTILYHLWTTKSRGGFVCRGWKSWLIVLVLIFLVNSTLVWSIAANISQLSDIADKLLHLKIWNQVDILVTACCNVRYWRWVNRIDQFRYIKIQPQTIDLSTRLWGINTEFVGFIPQSLVLRSIFWDWILIYRNWSIAITSLLKDLTIIYDYCNRVSLWWSRRLECTVCI